MRNAQKVFVIILAVLATASSQCSPECLFCDEMSGACIACGGTFENHIFGECHPNTIDKCITYGANSECFRCQPTFTLKGGKCVKTLDGCLSSGTDAECYQCGYNLLTEGTKCKGVINCKSYA